MNKFEYRKMVKNKVLIFVASVIVIASIFFVSAVQFSEVGSVTNLDNFYSPYETWINVSTNATVTGAGDSIVSVKANFTAINSTACGSGYLNLSYTGGYWIGNCSVSTFFTNASQITPIRGNITFVVENSTGNFSSLQQMGSPLVILMHNLGVPNMSDAAGCTKAGSKTTNMSSTSITNFANVTNYLIHVQINFTCLTGGTFRGANQDLFNDAVLINLTSINMSSSDIGTKLSNLRTTVQVNITSPRTFGASRIDVNTTAFSELNSAGWVTLYHLPLVAVQEASIGGDNIAKLFGFSRIPNGFTSTLNVSSMNLSLQIIGFSGYNVSDNAVPTMSIITPGTTKNSTSFMLNISINGTGTELSKVIINITNTSGQVNFTMYNYTVNTAKCNATTNGGEFYYCAQNMTLSAGTYSINVTAWDYGGVSPGNVNTAVQALTIDTTAPTLNSISHDPSTTSVTISYNASEEVNVSVSYGTTNSLGLNKTISAYDDVDSFSISGLTADEPYYYNITICDRSNNCARNGTFHFDTDAETSEDGGDGGGGTGSDFWITSYYLTDSQFEDGATRLLKVGYRIKMKIGRIYHSVGVVKLTSSKATINVSSDPQQEVLEEGESAKFDVTDDKYYDILVILNEVNSTMANITIKSINETMPSTTTSLTGNVTGNRSITTAEGTAGEGAEEETGTSFLTNKWFWIAVGVIVVVGVAAGYKYRKKLRKNLGYE